jgi:hypothetical protein
MNLLQAAEQLHLDRNTVSSYLRQGLLKGRYDRRTRTWSIPRTEVENFLRRRGGVGMEEMLTKLDHLYVDAVALVSTAAAQYLDGHRALTERSKAMTPGDPPPEPLIREFQERLDNLVDVIDRYQKVALMRGTLSVWATEGVDIDRRHPEDRTIDAPRQEA